ncbi:TonB-dependent receptor [Croceiramulus getboli]|nr:TonB-dependent receptor [Flavobacteriaceae bacterium YJPT1-3]
MRLQLSLLLVVLAFSLHAQKITVFDADSRMPLPGVAIYNPGKTTSAVTNFDGEADISAFAKAETLIFSEVAHRELRLTKAQIASYGYSVFLKADEQALSEVVLSVSKFAQNKREVPQKTIGLSPEDILLANPQTSADLLESSGQVYVQKSQLGGGSPLIRGFSTNRLLITLDGVRFNTAIFRGGNVQNVISIDPLTIARTEVLLGPGSVVYGSDAVGGVMNFYTQKPRFSFEEGTAFEVNTLARYATANQEKTGHVDFNAGTKEWGFLTSVSYSDFEDLRMGSHGPDDYLRRQYAARINGEDVVLNNDDPEVQIPTGFQQLHLMQKVRYMPSSIWDFNLGLHYSTTSDYPRYDRLTRTQDGVLRSAEWYYGPQNWFMGNLQINKKGFGLLYDRMQLTAAYQLFEESRNDRDFGDVLLFETDEQVDAYSLGLDFTRDFRNKSNKLYYGLEYVYNRVSSNGQQTNILNGNRMPGASRYPDGSSWQSMAAYASGQFKLSRKLNLQGGLRYNHILLDADFSESPFYDFPFDEANISTGNLTGSLGVAWQVNNTLAWKLNLSTAFRAPNIDDVGKIFDSEPGAVVVPNPDLKAEYAYNGDLGVLLNFEDVVQLDVAFFYTRLSDALVRRDFVLDGQTQIEYQGELSTVQAIQNTAQAEVYGLEAGMSIQFTEHWQLNSQLNITEGFEEQDNGDTAPLRHAAPLFGNTHLTWKRKAWKLDAFAEYNGQFSFDELAPSQQNNAFLYASDANGNPYAPRWYTLNLAAQYEWSPSLTLTTALENITDQRYRPYSSGISAPGRNLIVAIKYSL